MPAVSWAQQAAGLSRATHRVVCPRSRLTRSGCTAPAYHSQAYHDDGWAAADSPTDIDKLSLVCGPDNRLIEETGWRTRKLIDSARLRGVRPGQGRFVDPIRAFTPALPRRSRGLPWRGGYSPCAGRSGTTLDAGAVGATSSGRVLPVGLAEITMTEPPTACGAQAVGGSANAPDHRALPDAPSM